MRSSRKQLRSGWTAGLLLAFSLQTPAFGQPATSGPDSAKPIGEASASQEETYKACIARHMHAQLARRAGRLLEARSDLTACWNSACPAAIQADCAEWHAEVERSIPAIVLGARSEMGDELDVQVTMDGKPLTNRLDGKAIELDPGQHAFHFERAGFVPVDRTLLIRAGEKNRTLVITFERSPQAVTKPRPTAAGIDAQQVQSQQYRPVPLLTYALAGTAILALTSFAYFGSSGMSNKNDLERCKPFCAESDVQEVQTNYLIANVSLGIAVLATGGAVVTYLMRPSISAPDATPAIGSSAMLRLGGEF